MCLNDFAIMILQRNPQVLKSPMGKELADILQNKDDARGQQMANNICNSYGVTKEEIVKQAKQFFHL